MIGWYLALDRCARDSFKDAFMWEGERNHVEGLMWSPNYEHFYWNGDERTWHGAVEKATEYATKEEAEGQSVFAMALDAAVAGHMHVVDAVSAYRREKPAIEARKLAQEERARHEKMRFKLGPGEGGVI